MKQEKCIFCGTEENLTREHTPSRGLFPDDYFKTTKPSLITIPSCKECNQSFSHSEELFRNFLVTCSTDQSDIAKDLLHGKITRSMKKSPGKAFLAVQKMKPVFVRSPLTGVIEPKALLNISEGDWKMYHGILDKYIKSLFFHYFKKLLPLNFQINHNLIIDESKIPDEIKKALKWNLQHKDVFAYAFSWVPETFQSVWLFVFYKKVIFCSIVASEENFNYFKSK